MLKFKKTLCACFTFILIIEAVAIASGARILENITAQINKSLVITYHGQEQHFTDAQGKTVYPISYGGSTYLPVRAVSNLFNEPINYDSVNYVVSIGADTMQDKYLVDLLNSGYVKYEFKSLEKNDLTFNGKTFNNAIMLDICNKYRAKSNSEHKTKFNVTGYKTLKATFGYVAMNSEHTAYAKDSDEEPTSTVTIKDQNDEVLTSFTMHDGDLTEKEITIPSKVTEIKFGGDCASGDDYRNGYIYIYDAKVLAE